MSLSIILVIAACTYASRAAALVVLPAPSERMRRVFDHLPAPLFAGLAALSLVTTDGTLPRLPIILAMAGALCTVPLRSLLLTLLGGLAGYAIGALFR